MSADLLAIVAKAIADARAETYRRRELLAVTVRCPSCGRYSERTTKGWGIPHALNCATHSGFEAKGSAA